MALPFPKKKNNINRLINNDQEGIWWKKAWHKGKNALASPPKALQSRGLMFEALEPRVLMSADITIDTAGLLNIQGDAGANTLIVVIGDNGAPNDAMPTMVMRVEIADRAGGVAMTIATHFPSLEAMEQLVAMGMEEGLQQAMGQIDAILAGAPAS